MKPLTSSPLLLFFVFFLALTLSIGAPARAWPPPTDSHPCYDPDDVFTWCNNDLPAQHFARYGTMDRLYNALVTFGGVNYHVTIKIYGVYYANGERVPDCDSTSATPAALYNTWTCASNVGDPYYQNWDACANRPIKMMLYCYPVEGCIDVTPMTAGDRLVALFLDTYLDTQANMLRPSTTAPRLNPVEAARHVYAMRPCEVGRICPDYEQPYGCP